MPKYTPLSDGSYIPKNSDLHEALEKLEDGVKAVFQSENYKEYLRVMSKFHNYSVNNTILIAMQKPSASLVAGYNAWQSKFGRYVKKGERGIKIISPTPQREVHLVQAVDKNGEPEVNEDGRPIITQKQEVKMGYKVAHVFDVSQTEGHDLPTMGVNLLDGTIERYEDVMKSIKRAAGCLVVFEKMPETTNGYFSHGVDKKIAIREGMPEAQTVKTALHELAHARMHDITEKDDIPLDRFTKEVQAESVAFTVANHFGMDTSEYSFGYIASWSSNKDIKELKGSLKEIKLAAHRIIEDIEIGLEEIERDRFSEVKEAAVFIPGHGYLEIHECDDGWDYTFYTTEFNLVDGGVIEEPDNILDALNDASELSGVSDIFDSAQMLDHEDFMEQSELVNSSPFVNAQMRQCGKQQTFVKHAQTSIQRIAAQHRAKHTADTPKPKTPDKEKQQAEPER